MKDPHNHDRDRYQKIHTTTVIFDTRPIYCSFRFVHNSSEDELSHNACNEKSPTARKHRILNIKGRMLERMVVSGLDLVSSAQCQWSGMGIFTALKDMGESETVSLASTEVGHFIIRLKSTRTVRVRSQ